MLACRTVHDAPRQKRDALGRQIWKFVTKGFGFAADYFRALKMAGVATKYHDADGRSCQARSGPHK